MGPQSKWESYFCTICSQLLILARFSSYINNLHPVKYKHLYSIIEAVLDKTIPLWNMSLSAVYRPREGAYKPRPCRIPYTEQVFNPDPDQMSEDGPRRGDYEDSDTYWERRDDWERSIRRVVLPNPGNFIAPTPTGVGSPFHLSELPVFVSPFFFKRSAPNVDLQNEDLVDLKRDYASRGLQVIVKLANIELTPEKPTYEGGTWHVEGQLVSPRADSSFLTQNFPSGAYQSFIAIKLTGNRTNTYALPPYTTTPIPISHQATSHSDRTLMMIRTRISVTPRTSTISCRLYLGARMKARQSKKSAQWLVQKAAS